jgi:hypothetical protein
VPSKPRSQAADEAEKTSFVVVLHSAFGSALTLLAAAREQQTPRKVCMARKKPDSAGDLLICYECNEEIGARALSAGKRAAKEIWLPTC